MKSKKIGLVLGKKDSKTDFKSLINPRNLIAQLALHSSKTNKNAKSKDARPNSRLLVPPYLRGFVRISFLFAVLFLVGALSVMVVSGAVFGTSSGFTNPVQSGFGGGSRSSFTGSNYQYQTPSFNSIYSSSQLREYWPILGDMENDQCEATSDFVVAIPPLGCTPAVVRSDLLEEQNVPVFCKLDAIQVNPLIKVSSIKTISFKGDYPNGVAGISFHPARAAVKSYRTLLGSPLLNNIGYITIVLKKNRVEEDMPEWVAGNLTATIRYDAENAYGTGRAEYYVEPLNDVDWEANYLAYSFWNGRGYLRLEGISEGVARIGLYTDKENKFRTIEVEEGKTSSVLYFPGFYCKAGLKIRLNKVVSPEKQALLRIDGSDVWVRRGSKILNNRCSVRDIKITEKEKATNDGKDGATSEDAKTTGEVLISCPGNRFTLTLRERAEGELQNKEYTNLEYSNYDAELKKTVNDLIDIFPSEKQTNGQTYGEEALFEQIGLAKELGLHKTQKELIDVFLIKYPNVGVANQLREDLRKLGVYDYKDAVKTVYVNNKYHSIVVDGFKDVDASEKKTTLYIAGVSYPNIEEKGEVISSDGKHRFFIEKIEPRYVKLSYYTRADSTKDWNKVTSNRTVRLDDSNYFGKTGEGREVSVTNIEVDEVAHISLIPEIRNTRTEANFTFRIGIEKRAIKLNPEKSKEKIENLNKTIKDWEETNEKLGNLIKGWKGACFATSTMLMLKTTIEGFSGKALARTKVMAEYRDICATKYPTLTRTQCYNELSGEISTAVDEYTIVINNVNTKMDKSVNQFKTDGFFSSSISNQTAYVNSLKTNFKGEKLYFDESGRVVSAEKLKEKSDEELKKMYTVIEAKDIKTAPQARAWLTWEQAQGKSKVTQDLAKEELEKGMGGALMTARANKVATVVETKTGLKVPFRDYRTNAKNIYWDGTKANKNVNGISKDEMVQGIWHEDGRRYIVTLEPQGRDLVIKKIFYVNSEGDLTELQNESNVLTLIFGVDGSSKKFKEIEGSYRFQTGGSCSYYIREGTARVRYYESGTNKGWPAIVPFDFRGKGLTEGWFVMVPPSSGTFVEGIQGYKASGDVSYFKICNVGRNHLIDNGKGDDLCQSFDVNTYASIDTFIPCPSLSGSDVRQLAERARVAIREAQRQYGQSRINIFGELINIGAAMTDTGDVDCQDFMSPEDCLLLFNVCDPVICPSSRCNLGGKMPVSNVVQSGILGSIMLCLPNAQEGIAVPICLTGIHAGFDGLIDIMKSEKKCLQQSIDTGEHVGICDEITSVYMCEFLWRQVGPFMDQLVPKLIESAYGTNQGARGGGEYLTITHAWNNLQKSIDVFKSTYAQNSFRAFQYRNVQEAGGEFCKAFVGTSFPTSAEALDSLLEPESPSQFYARFDEIPFSEATVPATSQYKVYYHIYAGNDRGAQYQVWLRNPPASGYYKTNPTIVVRTGYIAKGDSADETIDFTAPEGYKELCVRINEQEECGFKQVTSSFAIDYAAKKFIEDQAEAEITSEKECISGTPSAWGLVNPNIQAGIEESIQPSIALRGIVRVCASSNPDFGVGATRKRCESNSECQAEFGNNAVCNLGGNCEYNVQGDEGIIKIISQGVGYNARWKNVGYCDDPNTRCWLDIRSVENDLRDIAAIENKTISNLIDDVSQMTEAQKKTERTVAVILEKMRKRIRELNPAVNVGEKAIKEIVENENGLNWIIGIDDYIPQGNNNQQAEAYSLKAKFYSIVIRGLGLVGVVPTVEQVEAQKKEEEKERKGTESEAEQKTDEPEIVIGFSLSGDNIYYNGEPTGLYLEGTDKGYIIRKTGRTRVGLIRSDGTIDFTAPSDEESNGLRGLMVELERDYRLKVIGGQLVLESKVKLV